MKKYVVLLAVTAILLGGAVANEPLSARRSDTEISLSDGRTFSTVYRAGVSGGRGPVAVTQDCLWWATGDKVFRRDLNTGRAEVYLPWSGASGEVLWLAPDQSGVTVTTRTGEWRIEPMFPGEDGFGGYVRARLGEDTERVPGDARLQEMSRQIEAWQGVPYLYGGVTKAGVDCSGFVGAVHRAVGLSLPRTSKDIPNSPRALTVRDELEWGDVLCFPGHVAIYIGNGRTAETRGDRNKPGQVGKGTIWSRKEVAIRRFVL